MHIFPQTLARLFPFSAQYFPGAQLNLLFALFFPSVYAFAAPHGTSALIFHFGNPERGSQPYPASFEHWWRGDDLSVGNGGRAKSTLRQLAAGHVPKEKPMFGAPIWADEHWNGFFRWYVKSLGALHSTVLDFGAFADEGQNVQFETQFKALLSVMHIGVETQLVMTTLPSFLKKELTFDILDQYAALLAGGSDNQQEVAAKFSHIVEFAWVDGPIRDALRTLPDPIGSHLADKALEVLWSDIRSSVLSGIFVDKRRPYGPTDEATAVSKTLRALRNTRHGFFLRRQVDEVLAIHDGNISERLPELTALYWLSLLAEPKLFLGALMRA